MSGETVDSLRKLAQNEATCFALNALLKEVQSERDQLRAENERLRKSCAGVIARSVHETRAATNSALDGYLAIGIAPTDAELDTLRQRLAELREVNRIQLEIATVHGAACVGIRKQRDKLRAVLEGAEYPNINNLYNLSIEDCRRVGEATAGLTKSIISSYKMKIEDIAKCRNAELGEIVWKFIDRMNDVCERDTAENIIHDFLKQVNPIAHSVIDAIWQSKKSSKKDA